MTNFFSKINISSVHGSRELSAFPISILPLFFSHWRKLQFWETNYSTCLTSITTPSAFSHSQNSRFGRSKKFSILIFCETKDLYLLITVRYICKKRLTLQKCFRSKWLMGHYTGCSEMKDIQNLAQTWLIFVLRFFQKPSKWSQHP